MHDSELLAGAAHRRARTAVRGIATQLAEGLRYVRRTPIIRLAIVTLGVVATAGINFPVLVPVYARDVAAAATPRPTAS